MAGAGMKEIKRRIKSVESTKQITKAMEYLIEKNVGVEVLKDARVTH